MVKERDLHHIQEPFRTPYMAGIVSYSGGFIVGYGIFESGE